MLAKLKFLKLYKRFGDGTFATFCREQLRITRWQVNDNIKAARVCMELIYAGFEILPTNISQAIALASLAGEELIEAWSKVIENIELDRITHKSIRSLLFPPTESDLPVATIKVSPTLHENIHTEAAERGMSIIDLIQTMFDFFISGGDSHLLTWGTLDRIELVQPRYRQHEIDIEDYVEKERIWREDLANLVAGEEAESL